MRHSYTLLLSLITIANVCTGASIGWNNFYEERPKTPGHFAGHYTVVPLTMRGTIEPGDNVLNFSGTIQTSNNSVIRPSDDEKAEMIGEAGHVHRSPFYS
ncbi:hypothetical protein DL771_005273 [Monosporascus sp. 5C6A]|nr:hypothetical protein DL771_005273 [Monosporascus sp. 5C6A]